MFFRNVLSLMLSFIVWNNSLWATAQAPMLRTPSEVEAVVKKMNDMKTIGDGVELLATFDAKRSEELKGYFLENPEAKTMKVPRIRQEGGRMIVSLGDKELAFSFFTDGKATISDGSSEAHLNNSMSVKEIGKELSNTMFTQKHVNVMDWLIPEAHAFPSELIIIALPIALITLAMLNTDEDKAWYEFSETSAWMKKMCKPHYISSKNLSVAELHKHYNTLSETFVTKCTIQTDKKRKTDEKRICDYASEVKKCLRERIAVKQAEEDFARKPKEYRPELDKYEPTTKGVQGK